MIPYHLYDYKEDFDFLKDEIPEGKIKWHFEDQLERARELLKNRNLAEIHHALDSLDWILREGGKLELTHSITVSNEKGHCFISRVKALKLFAEITDISDQTLLPNATWSDYFAVLTLAYIAEALHPNNFAPTTSKNYLSEGDYPFSLDHLIECVEAVCTAECFRKLEHIAPDEKEILRKNAQKGGRISASRLDDLKIKVISHYLKHYKTRSNREAAKRIYKDLQTDIDDPEKGLSGDDPAHTIEKWIGQYKNGLLNITIIA